MTLAIFQIVKKINKDSLFHPFFFKRHCLNHPHRCTCIVTMFASEIIPPRGETKVESQMPSEYKIFHFFQRNKHQSNSKLHNKADNFSCTCRYQQTILSHSPPKVSNHEVNSQHSSYVMFLVISCKKLSWDRQLLRESVSVPQRIWPTSSPALTPPVFFGMPSLF